MLLRRQADRRVASLACCRCGSLATQVRRLKAKVMPVWAAGRTPCVPGRTAPEAQRALPAACRKCCAPPASCRESPPSSRPETLRVIGLGWLTDVRRSQSVSTQARRRRTNGPSSTAPNSGRGQADGHLCICQANGRTAAAPNRLPRPAPGAGAPREPCPAPSVSNKGNYIHSIQQAAAGKLAKGWAAKEELVLQAQRLC